MIDKSILKWLPKRPKIVGVENLQPLLFQIVLLFGMAIFLLFKGKWKWSRLFLGGIISLLYDMKNRRLYEKVLQGIKSKM